MIDGGHDHDEYERRIDAVEGKVDDTEFGLQQLAKIVGDLAERLSHTDLAEAARGLIPEGTQF
jgi:hypothetical protein